MNEATNSYRLRCAMTKLGCVNTCPACGRTVIADWHFDSRRDPFPEDGPIYILTPEDDAVVTLRDMGMTTALPCEDCPAVAPS